MEMSRTPSKRVAPRSVAGAHAAAAPLDSAPTLPTPTRPPGRAPTLPTTPLSPPAQELEAFTSDVSSLLEAISHARGIQLLIDRWLVEAAALLADRMEFVRSDSHGQLNYASEEISMTLGISRRMAERYVAVGRAVARYLPGLDAAMEAGIAGIEKAWAFVDALGDVPFQVALAVEDAVLPRIETRTPGELRRDVARALAEVHPDGADDRHTEAVARRCVDRPRPEADGMASLRLLLPAEDALTIDAALDAAARAARANGDQRTSCQLRADAITSWAHSLLRNGWTWEDTAIVGPVPAAIKVTVPLEVLARALPGWSPPPSWADAYHSEITGEPLPGNSWIPLGLHTAGTAGEPASCRVGRTEAAWLEGYGPIAPATAIMLAAGGTWKRIITDTITGAPLDVGRTAYTPPPHIADAVRFRDPVCARPGCSTPAGRCEMDHITEWQHGGETSLANLAPLCLRCHRIKTLSGGVESHTLRDGSRTWTSATGRTYTSPPSRPNRAT